MKKRKVVWRKNRIFFLFVIALLFLIGLSVILFLGFEDVAQSPEQRFFNGDTLQRGASEKIPGVQLFNKQSVMDRMAYVSTHGKSTVKTGDLEVVHVDDFENARSENQYFFREGDGKRSRVYFSIDPRLISGERIEIRGRTLEVNNQSEFAVDNYEILYQPQILAGVAANPNLGEQKVAYVRIKFLDDQTDFLSETEAYSIMAGVSQYYRENSYGKSWLVPTVYPYYTLSLNAKCDISAITDKILNDPLISRDINWLTVDKLVIVWGANLCSFGGAGSVGEYTHQTSDGPASLAVSWLNGVYSSGWNFGVTAHELGHNFGIEHANFLNCGASTIDLINKCFTVYYGDPFDIMGLSNNKGYFNIIHKETIGWLDPQQILEVNSRGSYFIEPLETNTGGVKGLKIPTSNYNYYFEYRRPIGFDIYNFNYGGNVYDGAMLHIDSFIGSGDTQLLDSSRNTANSLDVVLRQGETFYDSNNDIMVTTLNLNDTSIELYVGSIDCGDGIIDLGEDCDGQNLNGHTCETLGFRYGNLGCMLHCDFDVSQCTGPICAPGDVYNGNNSCTAIFTADNEGTGVYRSSMISVGSWDDLRKSPNGDGISPQPPISDYLLLLKSDPSTSFSLLYRISIPFYTSSLPDSAIIDSAELSLSKSSDFYINTHPNSDDFITIVPTTLKNPPFLTTEDFDQFSSVDNPMELSDRFDISGQLASNVNIVFPLNSDGLATINNNGYTVFGLRGGYDLYTTPNNGEYTELQLFFMGSKDPSLKPTLIVNYTVPKIVDDGYGCIDPDGPDGIYTKSTTYVPYGESDEDYCQRTGGRGGVYVDYIHEQYCDNGVIMENVIKCDNGCVDGACLEGVLLNGCQTLDKPNTKYILAKDITTTSDCFVITANNITLDGNGFSIIGDDSAGDIGVNSLGMKELKIENLKIFNFGTGISLTVVSDSIISDNLVDKSVEYGIYINRGVGNIISNNRVDNSGLNGIALGIYSDNNLVENNILDSNKRGLNIVQSSQNSIRNNNIVNNEEGVVLFSSSNNNFDSNLVCGSLSMDFSCDNSESNTGFKNTFATRNECVWADNARLSCGGGSSGGGGGGGGNTTSLDLGAQNNIAGIINSVQIDGRDVSNVENIIGSDSVIEVNVSDARGIDKVELELKGFGHPKIGDKIVNAVYNSGSGKWEYNLTGLNDDGLAHVSVRAYNTAGVSASFTEFDIEIDDAYLSPPEESIIVRWMKRVFGI
ncbi:MAG: NosD domain-containing protein [Nanoarchaeota archaeon]